MLKTQDEHVGELGGSTQKIRPLRIIDRNRAATAPRAGNEGSATGQVMRAQPSNAYWMAAAARNVIIAGDTQRGFGRAWRRR